MESLVRTRVAGFSIEESLKLAEIEQLAAEKQLKDKVLPVEGCFSEYRAYQARPEADRFLYNGNSVYGHQAAPMKDSGENKPDEGEFIRMYDSKGTFIGVFAYDGANRSWKPKKMFYSGSQG